MKRKYNLFLFITALTIILFIYFNGSKYHYLLKFVIPASIVIYIFGFIKNAYFLNECPKCGHSIEKIPKDDIFPKFNECPSCGFKQKIFDNDGPL